MESISDKKRQTVEEFISEKLHLSLSQFLEKDRRHKIKLDLPVKLTVQPPHHYRVTVETIIRAQNFVRVLGFNHFGMNPMGYTNVLLVELFDTPIVLKEPLECSLENLVKAMDCSW